MRLLASYFWMSVRQGVNYVNQTRELRLLAVLGLGIYLACSLVMGVSFSDSMSQVYHENAPELFSAWFNRRLTWGLVFIGVVTLLATIATLFQAAQRDELERLRLLPVPDAPFFSMRVLDICLGVFLFFPLLVALPILRFCVIEGLSVVHGLALLAGIVLVTLEICFLQMTLAVAAARLVPERLVRHKALLYLVLAGLGALFYGMALVVGRRESDVGFVSDVAEALPGKILLFSIQKEGGAVWSYLWSVFSTTVGLAGLSYLGYSRLYLRRFDLLMDKLVARERVEEDRPTAAERVLAYAAPLLSWAAGGLLGSADAGARHVPLAAKELRGTLRDPSVHLVLAFALLFVALPGLAFSAREPVLGLQVTYFLAVATALVFNAILAVSSVGREGPGLGLMSFLPVRTEELLLAKATAALVFHAFVSLGLGLGVLLLPFDFGTRVKGALYLFAASLATGAVLAFLSTGLGAIFPKFDAKNQFLAVNRFGVAIFFGLATLLAVSSAVAFAFPIFFGPLYVFVPALLLGIWGFVGGVLFVEGSRALRGALTRL
ncbi:MAG: hypothetical protein HYZ53_24460 [Planctomycetes bacterium]|nr:hypothetical protein [Planctomycetota bacterium]